MTPRKNPPVKNRQKPRALGKLSIDDATSIQLTKTEITGLIQLADLAKMLSNPKSRMRNLLNRPHVSAAIKKVREQAHSVGEISP